MKGLILIGAAVIGLIGGEMVRRAVNRSAFSLPADESGEEIVY